MADPKPDAYSKYRTGLIKRHIACSGRYLSVLWLKEYEPNKDPMHLLRNKRNFRVPTIPSFAELKTPIFRGIVEAPFEQHWGPYYVEVADDFARYKLPGLGEGEIGDKERVDYYEWFISFNQGQSEHRRTYVPWLSRKSIVYGGGDNPLLRGGIAMATFAIEYIIKRKNSSLRYATHLLQYFERCEVENSGYFLRCDNLFNVSGELNKSASIDEIVGLVLGLYYLFRASEGHMHLRKRVQALTRRLAHYLQCNAYLIMSPMNHELHRGFAGGYVFQWALQQAFEKITGERYEPKPSIYQSTSKALLDVVQDRYIDSSGKLRYRRLRYGAEGDIDVLISIMWLWGKHGHLSQYLVEKWDEELNRVIENAIPANLVINGTTGASFVRESIEEIVALLEETDLDIAHFADPFHRYHLNFKIQSIAIYLWETKNWYNHAMTFHTLHFALDEDLMQNDADARQAAKLASSAQMMIKTVLCGERLPKPTGPLTYELGEPDDDFYAAVIAKGLLSNFSPFAEAKCSRLPPTVPIQEVPYSARVDSALEKRQRLWHELPLGELSLIRRGNWQGVVRWHNSYIASKAMKGMDFCWESWPQDEDERRRILRWQGGEPKEDRYYATERATGLPVNRRQITQDWAADSDVKSKAAKVDVVLEAGGLDFLFPRVLMSLWLDEPLQFDNSSVRSVRGATCLPLKDDGFHMRLHCSSRMQDWLLLSTPYA